MPAQLISSPSRGLGANHAHEGIPFTGAAANREATVTAIAEFNRRRRMAALAEHAGQGESMITLEELQAQRCRRTVGRSGVPVPDGAARAVEGCGRRHGAEIETADSDFELLAEI